MQSHRENDMTFLIGGKRLLDRLCGRNSGQEKILEIVSVMRDFIGRMERMWEKKDLISLIGQFSDGLENDFICEKAFSESDADSFFIIFRLYSLFVFFVIYLTFSIKGKYWIGKDRGREANFGYFFLAFMIADCDLAMGKKCLGIVFQFFCRDADTEREIGDWFPEKMNTEGSKPPEAHR